MQCFKCKKDTPDTEMYCTHCGFKLDVTYDEITSKLKEDVKEEKELDTEAFSRWCLAVSIVIFVTAILFRSLWKNLPVPNPTPNYIPSEENSHETIHATKPLYIKKKKK